MKEELEIENRIRFLESKIEELRPYIERGYESVEAFFNDEIAVIKRKENYELTWELHKLRWSLKTEDEKYEKRFNLVLLAEKFNDDVINESKINFMRCYIDLIKMLKQLLLDKSIDAESKLVITVIFEKLDEYDFVGQPHFILPKNYLDKEIENLNLDFESVRKVVELIRKIS